MAEVAEDGLRGESGRSSQGGREQVPEKVKGSIEHMTEIVTKKLFDVMDKKKENGRSDLLREVAHILEQANKARPLDEVSLEEVEEVEASNSKQTVTEVEKSKCRPSLDSLRKRPDMGYTRSRSRSPLKYRRSKQGNDSESPFYKENIKSDWSWSRIKEEQRKPGVCRKLPDKCKPWVGRDGRFKTCGYSHPWLSQ